LSTALLIFLATVLYQTDFMRSNDPGFNKDKILVFENAHRLCFTRTYGLLCEEFLKVKSVSEVGIGGFASTPVRPMS